MSKPGDLIQNDSGGQEEKPPTPTPARTFKRRDVENRRTILRSVGAGIAVVGLSLVGLYPVIKHLFERLRPPGALEEDLFLSACIKCGQCVQVCPVEAIKLGDGDEGYAMGTPYIDPRRQACDFSCDATQCVLACPTGALSHDISRKEEVRMGMARVARATECLAYQGKGFKGLARGDAFLGLHRYVEVDRWQPIPIASHEYEVEICDLCVRECPIEGAISLQPAGASGEDRRFLPVITDKCVGCGTCEMMCPSQPAAIVVDPKVIRERMA